MKKLSNSIILTVNALARRPDLYVLHFIQLIVDKYDAGQQLHMCGYDLKFKILG